MYFFNYFLSFVGVSVSDAILAYMNVFTLILFVIMVLGLSVDYLRRGEVGVWVCVVEWIREVGVGLVQERTARLDRRVGVFVGDSGVVRRRHCQGCRGQSQSQDG